MPGGRPMGAPRPQSDDRGFSVEAGVKKGLGALQKGLKPAGQAIERLTTPDLGTFNRGASEGAFQAQRGGERQDFTSPASVAPVTGSNIWGSGGALAPSLPNFDVAAPDTTFSMMPQSSGDLSAVAPGASVPGTGGMSIGAPSGWTGGAGQIGGVAAAGLGGALSAYNLAQAIQAGNPMGIAQGALGTAAGVGATAAAAGYAPAAAVMSAVAAPLAVAGPILMAAAAYMGEEDRKNMMEKLRQVNMRNSASVYQGGTQQAADTAVNVRDIVSSLSPQGQQAFLNTTEQLLSPSDQQKGSAMSPVPMSALESIGQMRNTDAGPQQAPGTSGTYNDLGTTAGKPFTELYKDLAYIMSQNPNLSIPSYDPQKSGDIESTIATLHANGVGGAPAPGSYQGYYSLLPGLPEPYVSGGFDFSQEGGPVANPVIPNPALNGQFSPEVLSSPFYAQEYWQSKGVTPQQAMLYGLGQNVNQAQTDLAPHLQDEHGLETMTPEYLQQFYSPANLYQYLTNQQGMSPVAAPPQPQAPSVGATEPSATGNAGGNALGGAGKLSPTFTTPEIDRVQQITGAGRLPGGSGQQQGAGGRPFGMSQPQGGMAVGQRPFGMQGGQPQSAARNQASRGAV